MPHPSNPILIVDDEAAALNSFEMILQANGYDNILRCQESRTVPSLLKRHSLDAVLLDLVMPGLSGEELLELINAESPAAQVIVVTGNDDLETAVRCMKLGAFDYLVKPVEETDLISSLHRALEVRELRRECAALRSRFLEKSGLERGEAFAPIATSSPAMFKIFSYLEAISDSRQPVLITGESGTGKELMAKAVHTLSAPQGPFVPVNVAGLDDAMFSDSLFGHVRGAYTGASGTRKGMAEKASGGVLFLDEIGDLSPASQVKLLRLVQEREFFPLGSDNPRKLDARLVFATHADLDELLAAGKLRKDLYYRLCIHHVRIPPLRERKGDLPLLLDLFIRKAAEEMGREIPEAAPETLTLLSQYDFPGNVRELEAMVHDVVSEHQSSGPIGRNAFARRLSPQALHDVQKHDQVVGLRPAPGEIGFPDVLPSIEQMSDLLVLEAMRRAEGKQTTACRMLGISQPALSKRLKRMRTRPRA